MKRTATMFLASGVAMALLAPGATVAAGTSEFYFTDNNDINLAPFDNGYDGSLFSMASVSVSVPEVLVSEVRVSVDISHTWVGDLVIKLQTPAGDVVDLVSRPGYNEPADDGSGCCGYDANLVLGTFYEFADSASALSETMGDSGSPVPSGSWISSGYQNAGGLSTLNYQFFPAGNWTLHVGDSEVGDSGVLDGFTLEIYPIELGACCLSNGACVDDTDQIECQSYMGGFFHPGSTCADGVCTPAGACCFSDGSCTFGSEADCLAGAGTYQGDFVECSAANCEPSAACCLADETCTVATPTDCTNQGGTFVGGDCASAECFVAGGPFAVGNHTFDCGGGRSFGDAFELTGTIGQPDASPEATGNTFELIGGFHMGGGADPCPQDLDGSGDVGFGDILQIIGAWGPCGEPCPQDLSGNGSVDFADILAVIGAWGDCP
jgi:subtilisin-like proprotein convertase family protein